MRSRWGMDRLVAADSPIVTDLSRQLGVHPIAAALLVNRDLIQADAARRFLNPSLLDLQDPSMLPGADAAARRIVQAIEKSQPIVIYGDYDVDGITASAILFHTLTMAGGQVSTYVPHRIEEGYGLHTAAIQQIADRRLPISDSESIKNQKSKTCNPLIITVDCGITAVEPAHLARQLGVDLIITDHHEFDPDHLPPAQALVHPRLPDPRTPTEPAPETPCADLCGAGVAFKLAWAVARLHCGSDRLPETFRSLLVDLLSLAALGTVADVVPLVGENRILTTFGLGRIKHTRFTGLNALIDASNLRNEKIDAYHIGFVLGPRLNACGRMGHARDAVDLLTTAPQEEARRLADDLTRQNDRRRNIERQVLNEARQMVDDSQWDLPRHRALVLGKEGWHPGVLGIVASRMVEAYDRPVVMLSCDNGQAQGSARSVPGISIHEALQYCAEHLDSFGGHAMAAGLRLSTSKIDAFRHKLVERINQQLPPEDLVGQLQIELTCRLEELSIGLFDQIASLSPFGRGNPHPLLCLRGARLAEPAKAIGAHGQHLRLRLQDGPHRIGAVAFGMGDLLDRLKRGMKLDVAFEPKVSNWQGRHRPELHVKDLRVVDDAQTSHPLSVSDQWDG